MAEENDISLLAAQIKEAQLDYEAACDSYDEAHRGKVKALNALNKVQRAFDKAIDAVKGSAHVDSDWRRAELPSSCLIFWCRVHGKVGC